MFEPGTFTYSRTVELTGGSSIDLQLLSFSAEVQFSPSPYPDLLWAEFSSFDFEYSPFDMLGATSVTKQVLRPGGYLGFTGTRGLLSLSDGLMLIYAPTRWETSSGAAVADSTDSFRIIITDTTQPGIVDVAFSSEGRLFGCGADVDCIPEPATVVLAGSALLMVALCCRRRSAGWKIR